MMKRFSIPVTWKMEGTIEIVAETIEDANELVFLCNPPQNGNFVANSIEIDYDSTYYYVNNHPESKRLTFEDFPLNEEVSIIPINLEFDSGVHLIEEICFVGRTLEYNFIFEFYEPSGVTHTKTCSRERFEDFIEDVKIP